MSNPKILYTDLSQYSFSGSLGTNSEYPLTNLNNYVVNSYWSGSTAIGQQKLIIDLGSVQDVSAVVVDGHNFTSTGTSAILQYADDAAFTSGVTSVISITKANDTPSYKTFASISKRYWAIMWTPLEVTMSATPRVGNIYLGTPLEFTTPYNYGYRTENAEYITSEKTSLSGIKRSSQIYKGRIVYELNFSLQDSTFSTAFQTFVKTVRGKMYPFYFIDTDGTTVRYMNLDSDYVPISVPQYGYADVESIVMKTNQSIY